MRIKKGTLLEVTHCRSGKWLGIATRDFDTDKEEFYPLALAQKYTVKGLNTVWEEGENMPCRNCLCKIKIRGDMNEK